MKRLLAVLIVVTSTWSCTKPPMSPSRDLSVSVAVSEKTSKIPLEGVDVMIAYRYTSAHSVGGASSRAVSFSSGDLIESGKTDANGVYTWLSVPDGTSSITITVYGTDGYKGVMRDVRLQAGDTRVDVELDRRGTYTVSGTVFEVTADGRRPVEGVGIEAWGCEGDDCFDLHATTDRSGNYSIPGMWVGLETGVWVSKTGYAVDDPRPFNCDGCDRLVTAGADTQLDIPLVRR